LTTIDNKYIECQKRNYASFGGKSIFFDISIWRSTKFIEL